MSFGYMPAAGGSVSGSVGITGPVIIGGLTPGTTGVHTAGTGATNIALDANCSVLRIKNISDTTIWYSWTSGITADDNASTGGMPIEAGERDEIPTKGGITIYFRSTGASKKFAFWQMKTS